MPVDDLERLLREDRPAPRPEFAAELDARAADGFPRRRRRGAPGARRARRPRLPRLPVLLPAGAAAALAAAVLAVTVVPLGGGTDDAMITSDGGGSVTQSESAGDTGGAEPAVGGSAVPLPVGPGDGSGADGVRDRAVERAASLVLAVERGELDRAARDVIAVADRLGGFVVSSSVSEAGPETGASGDFLLRVPVARLPDALTQLGRLGTVRERNQSAQDITAELVSARSRLRTAQAERRSLLRRLEDARSERTSARLRDRLSAVDRRIAALKAELARVDSRARFANVSVTLLPEATGDRDDGSGFGWSPGDAARDALRVLEVALGVTMVVLAAALPLGLLVALGLAGRRLAVRRARERALDAV